MTRRSDHSPQLQSYFSACARTFLKFRTPPPDSEFCFESRQNFPKKRTRYDCKSPHPDKRKERGSHDKISDASDYRGRFFYIVSGRNLGGYLGATAGDECQRIACVSERSCVSSVPSASYFGDGCHTG